MSWARLDDAFPDNPKIAALSDAAFRAHVTAICYAARNLTDGFVPMRTGRGFAGRGRVVQELVPGLWEIATDGFYVHDYLDYNPTRAAVEAEKARKQAAYEARVEAGRIGGQRSGESRRSRSEANTEANDEAKPPFASSKTPSKTEANDEHPDPVSGSPPDLELSDESSQIAREGDRPKRTRHRSLTEDDVLRFREDFEDLDVPYQAEKYRTWHQSKGGKVHVDEVAGFRNWLRGARERAKQTPAPRRSGVRTRPQPGTAADFDEAEQYARANSAAYQD